MSEPKTPFRAEYASASGQAFVVDARGNPVAPEWICDRLNATTPADAASEREAFEQSFNGENLSKTSTGWYVEAHVQYAWQAWQARAARTTPAAAVRWTCGQCGHTHDDQGQGPEGRCPKCGVTDWSHALLSASPQPIGDSARNAAKAVLNSEHIRFERDEGGAPTQDKVSYIAAILAPYITSSPPAADAPARVELSEEDAAFVAAVRSPIETEKYGDQRLKRLLAIIDRLQGAKP
jgi:hypothetical protein